MKKKLIAVLLVASLVFVMMACGTKETPAAEDKTEETAEEPETEEPEEVAEETTEPAAETYVPLAIDFKNKTGKSISGLYLYPTGAAEKGNSICPAEWIDQDNDPNEEFYELFTYIVRPVADSYEIYVEFADGTNATWEGLTVANHDKFSLKNGPDPSTWEQEPADEEDWEEMDAVVAEGKTTDNYYPGYEILGLELKNKTGKDVTEYYFSEAGSTTQYNNMVPCLVDEDGNNIEKWVAGKGGLYAFGFFIRPTADSYTVNLVFDDGETLEITDIDLLKPNGDGFLSNEISMKDAVDPDLTEVSYDDGDPEPLQYIKDAIAAGIPLDKWYPTY
ncbi:MAG: hypothetical protein LBQ95_07625 [Lachnospiraceae bacterium]|jgi:hypothetical protein|nr:hypothetical protein [Lachnospiraceae bacterium]